MKQIERNPKTVIWLILLFIMFFPFQTGQKDGQYLTNGSRWCSYTNAESRSFFVQLWFQIDKGECDKDNGISLYSVSFGPLPHLDKLPQISWTRISETSYRFSLVWFAGEKYTDADGYIWLPRPQIGVKNYNVDYSLWEFDYDTVFFFSCEPHWVSGPGGKTSECDIAIRFFPLEVRLDSKMHMMKGLNNYER